jgi:hypothetical protein
MAETLKAEEGKQTRKRTIFDATWCHFYGFRFEGPCPYHNNGNCILNGRPCYGRHDEILIIPKKSLKK